MLWLKFWWLIICYIKIKTGFDKLKSRLFVFQMKVVTEFVKTEETEAGMGTAKVTADEWAEEAMGKTDDPRYQWNMYAFDESENTGVAPQFFTELIKSA